MLVDIICGTLTLRVKWDGHIDDLAQHIQALAEDQPPLDIYIARLIDVFWMEVTERGEPSHTILANTEITQALHELQQGRTVN